MIILLLGVGTIVMLWDVKGAYRTLNAKPSDWHLQLSWLLDVNGVRKFFVDLVNPFGRIESQRNWEAVAGAIEWIMQDMGAHFCRHYVDNFFAFCEPGPTGPDWETAKTKAKWIFAMMKALGVPFHEVQVGTSFSTLGWCFDTLAMTISVKEEKRTIAIRLLREWVGKELCSLRELERLVGFLRWLSLAFYELSPILGQLLRIKREKGNKLGGHTRKSRDTVNIAISRRTNSFLQLSLTILLEWNGTRSLWDWQRAITSAHIWCDASEWGFGAYFLEAGQYFFRAWTQEEKEECFREERLSMMQMELRAIVAALCTWRAALHCVRVQIVTDNEYAKDHGTSGEASQPDCRRTIKALWAEKLKAQCVVDLVWRPGKDNVAADFLSRPQGEEEFRRIKGFEHFLAVPESHPLYW
jgi:ribonuclease HI